jgi:hypothetical protein
MLLLQGWLAEAWRLLGPPPFALPYLRFSTLPPPLRSSLFRQTLLFMVRLALPPSCPSTLPLQPCVPFLCVPTLPHLHTRPAPCPSNTYTSALPPHPHTLTHTTHPPPHTTHTYTHHPATPSHTPTHMHTAPPPHATGGR